MTSLQPTIVAVASGKGGVGKTIFSACLATLAAENSTERRVLLADMDFGVKGLTFLYASADYWLEHRVVSMADWLRNSAHRSKIFEDARRFNRITVIPADINFQSRIDWDSYLPEHSDVGEAIRSFVEVAPRKGFQLRDFRHWSRDKQYPFRTG